MICSAVDWNDSNCTDALRYPPIVTSGTFVTATENALLASSAFSRVCTPTPVSKFVSTMYGRENPNPSDAGMSRMPSAVANGIPRGDGSATGPDNRTDDEPAEIAGNRRRVRGECAHVFGGAPHNAAVTLLCLGLGLVEHVP